MGDWPVAGFTPANDQIRDKLSFAFADLGGQTVKNISRAVGVFGLTSKEINALPEPELAQPDIETTVGSISPT